MTPKQIRVMVLNDMEKLDRTLFRLDQGKFQLTFNALHRPEASFFLQSMGMTVLVYCSVISSLCYVRNVCGYL